MKLSNEAKVGLIGIVTIIVVIWGVNYLKGRNILSSTYPLLAFYMDSGGLEASSPVLMNGVKVGYIEEITLHPEEKVPIRMVLSIEKTYPIPKGSRAVQVSTDLMGSKAIQIEMLPIEDPLANREYYKENDMILTAVEQDLISSLEEQIVPVMDRISDLAVSMDRLVQQIDTLLISEATVEMVQNLSDISKSIASTLEPGGSLNQSLSNLESFTSLLKDQEENVASLTGNLNSLSESLDSAGLDKLSMELLSVTEQLNQLLLQINSGEGSAGKLIYSDSLYANLEILITDLDTLINDLTENPGDYVHISVFGKSKKKKD